MLDTVGCYLSFYNPLHGRRFCPLLLVRRLLQTTGTTFE